MVEQRPKSPDTEGHFFRLAGNDNETVVTGDDGGPVIAPDTEGHRLATNDNETVDDDGRDTEGQMLAANDNETVVTDRD